MNKCVAPDCAQNSEIIQAECLVAAQRERETLKLTRRQNRILNCGSRRNHFRVMKPMTLPHTRKHCVFLLAGHCLEALLQTARQSNFLLQKSITGRIVGWRNQTLHTCTNQRHRHSALEKKNHPVDQHRKFLFLLCNVLVDVLRLSVGNSQICVQSDRLLRFCLRHKSFVVLSSV